jgi:F-type H+-transporting ATPase subunit b
MLSLLLQVPFLAQGVEEEPQGVDLIIPEVEELVAGIIAFLIVFVVIWVWVRPRISRMIAHRQETISGRLTEAEQAKVEAEELAEEHRKQLADAHREAGEIVEEARRSAESVRAELVDRAHREAEEITERAQQEAAAEKERASAEVRAQAETLDEDAQRELVERYIEEITEMGE